MHLFKILSFLFCCLIKFISNASADDNHEAAENLKKLPKDDMIRYLSVTDVIYECIPTVSFWKELIFNHEAGLVGKSPGLKFLNPSLTLGILLEQHDHHFPIIVDVTNITT